MVAAPFTQTILLVGAKNGRPIFVRCTLSDVADAFAVFPDGNTTLQIPADQPYLVRDVIVVTGGTDTAAQQLFVNGLSTPIIIDNKSNLNTANSRQFQQAGVPLAAGSAIRLQQQA